MSITYVGGKGKGKNAFSDMIINVVSNADSHTKLKDIPYSTDVREVVTVEDMISHSIRRGDFK